LNKGDYAGSSANQEQYQIVSEGVVLDK